MRKICILTYLLLMTTVVSVAQEDMIMSKTRKKYYPSNGKIRLLNNKGKISFTNSRTGKVVTLRRIDISFMRTHKPRSVAVLETLFRSLAYEKVITFCDKVKPISLWTGWGSYVYYVKAMAQMNLEKYEDAKKSLKESLKFSIADNTSALIRGGLAILHYAQNGGQLLKNQATNTAFLLNGLAMEKKNDFRGAALEYMKAQMLCRYKSIRDFSHLVAMARLIAILKKNKDVGTAGKVMAELRGQ